jgi:hypothetical protein
LIDPEIKRDREDLIRDRKDQGGVQDMEELDWMDPEEERDREELIDPEIKRDREDLIRDRKDQGGVQDHAGGARLDGSRGSMR